MIVRPQAAVSSAVGEGERSMPFARAYDVVAAAGLDPEIVRPVMRPDEVVMDPAVLGAMPNCAVSFSRALMRRMIAERWQLTRTHWGVSAAGAGGAVYRIQAPDHVMTWAVLVNSFDTYSFDRERAIEANWDIVAVLLAGDRDESVLGELRDELAAGRRRYHRRAPDDTIILAHANRSDRVFQYTVDSLAAGLQPEARQITQAGYLLRNVGLEGNGFYRSRAFLSLGPDHPIRLPYHGEMLAAYMLREVSIDLAEHLAAAASPDAVAMDPALRRYLGVGNSSGLGLVFYALQHPRLLSRWLEVREVALAASKCSQPRPDSPEVERLSALLRARSRYARDDVGGDGASSDDVALADELRVADELVGEFATCGTIAGVRPEYAWRALCDTLAERVGRRTLEAVHGLLIDLDTQLADRLVRLTVVSEVEDVDPTMTCGRLEDLVHSGFEWALRIDMDAPDARRYWYYRSIDVEEPRRGLRADKPPDAVELLIDLPGEVQALAADLRHRPRDERVADLLLAHPHHRGIVARVQSLENWPYHTPRANVHGRDFRPADVIHVVKGAFFGADRCHVVERSLGRWVRGLFHSGAPTPGEIAAGTTDDWMYPCLP
jgi:hypothetical protein